jgi:hypothetical protein
MTSQIERRLEKLEHALRPKPKAEPAGRKRDPEMEAQLRKVRLTIAESQLRPTVPGLKPFFASREKALDWAGIDEVGNVLPGRRFFFDEVFSQMMASTERRSKETTTQHPEAKKGLVDGDT